MTFFEHIIDELHAVRELVGDVPGGQELPLAIDRLDDADMMRLLTIATETSRAVDRVCLVASGLISRRSSRDAGHAGLAQSRGHRSPVSLVQELAGTSRADAAKQVRVGESLCAPAQTLADGTDGATAKDAGATLDAAPRAPWHAPLNAAVLAGTVTAAQHDAIRRGLGDPPESAETGTSAGTDESNTEEAWSLAAEALVTEASVRTLEELAAAARAIRDQLDPAGAEARFDARHEARAFRLWKDADGIQHASFVFEDEGAAWIRTIHDSALRPRRGGPRFVDSAEKVRARSIIDDPRTNDQLAYDLVLDVLRAGALADAPTVFGTRQPGLRIVRIVDGEGTDASHLEDDGTRIPTSLAARQVCESGERECITDRTGNPLRLGRTQRLFSTAQRVALAIRDGGCRWNGCDRPASYCEAHHIDEWDRDGGRTDVDRGILLCRYHHMTLHHNGWRITRDGLDDFMLHPPGRAPAVALRRRLAHRYAWQDVDPPPRRFFPAV